MVEVLRNMDGIYNKWKTKVNPNLRPPQQPEIKHVRPVRKNVMPASRRYYPNQHVPSDLQFSASVAPFKSYPITTVFKNEKRQPNLYLGYACLKCAPTSQASLVSDVCKAYGMKNILNVPQQNLNRSFVIRKFAHISFIFSLKSFSYNTLTCNLTESDRVKQGIEKAVSQDCENGLNHPEFWKVHRKRAYKAYKMLKSAISSKLLKITAWVLMKVFGRLFTSVQVHQGQMEALRKAEKFSKPIVYLPLHKSHLDYIFITFSLVLNNIRAPLIAAGDNLHIPVFGFILNRLGGFFIKRKLDNGDGKKDYVYRSVLHSFIVESLKQGHSMEFFVEGGRSRTGKTCLPKAGLLSIVIDAYLQGDIEDLYIVPVAVSYERLIEGNFVAEQLGRSKVKETFWGAVSSIFSVLSQKYGNVRIDYGQPFILSEFLQSVRQCQPASPNSSTCSTPPLIYNSFSKSSSILSLYGSDVAVEEHRQLVNSVALHIVHDAANFSSLMCTNLFAFLLLTRHRDGSAMSKISEDFKRLRDDLSIKKKNVGFYGDDEDVVQYACSMLPIGLVSINGNLTNKRSTLTADSIIKPNLEQSSVIELSYYSAPVVATYFLQSVVATAIVTSVNADIQSLRGCDCELSLSQEDLLDACLTLCDIMQFENIFFPPCTNLTTVMSETIEDFITQELLYNSSNKEDPDQKKWMSSFATSLSWSREEYDNTFFASPQLSVNLDEEFVDKLLFLRNVLSPYIESYWVSSIQLYKLIHSELEEKVFLKLVQMDVNQRLEEGSLLYTECVAMEIIRNSLKLFELWGVVEHYKQDSVKLLYLGRNHNNSDQISSVIAKIQKFRT